MNHGESPVKSGRVLSQEAGNGLLKELELGWWNLVDDGTNQPLAELFPRGDGTTHITAFSDQSPLPIDPATITPDPSAIERLEAIAERLSPAFSRERIIARQSCFRPVTQDGLPLIGPVPGLKGAYVATGHSVWGMLNAPATGEAMADLILDGSARRVDLARFAPGRLRPFDPARLMSS